MNDKKRVELLQSLLKLGSWVISEELVVEINSNQRNEIKVKVKELKGVIENTPENVDAVMAAFQAYKTKVS